MILTDSIWHGFFSQADTSPSWPVPVLSVSALTSLVIGAVGYGAVRERVNRSESFRTEIGHRFDRFETDVNRRFDEMDTTLREISLSIGRLQGAQFRRHDPPGEL